MNGEFPVLYLEFIRLFNAGGYFESHEVLEALWRRTRGKKKLFYQGLIQLAVALHHLSRDNRDGVEKTFLRAGNKLSRYPGIYGGVHVRKLLADAEARLNGNGPAPMIRLKGAA